MDSLNYVAKLNEFSQKKRRSQPNYVDLGSSGPDHNKTFTQRVVLDGVEYPEGVGKTKREAKQAAAKKALTRLLENQQDSDDSIGAGASSSCSWLSEHDQKNRVAVKAMESAIGSNNTIIDKTRRLNMNSQDNSCTESNFTGLVNQYCQERNLTYVFSEEGMSGPSHNPQFFCSLVIGKTKYAVGEGKNKKEARRRAAQLAWSALQEQSDWDSEPSLMSITSEDNTPTKSNCNDSSSQDVSMGTSHSIEFRHSSNHPEDQMTFGSSQIPSTPPSADSLKRSKKRAIFKDPTNPAKKQDDEMKHSVVKTPPQSKFTSEFDSIEHLGKGGFGSVYKAREKLLDVFYAVKIVACKEKALREVKALSDLSHQNIVRYYTCWIEESQYKDATGSITSESASNSPSQYLYIKMELCDTKTLRHWIRKRNQRTEQVFKRSEASLKIAQQVVLGVEYIHSKSFIHRDLKPDNIMFGQDGAVKIGDFGLVTAEARPDDGHQLKRTKAGTRSYMAPEQKTHPVYDHKVDIFALGLIFFELLWKMSTGHDKIVTWKNVRCQKFPEAFREYFFQEAQTMKQMLSETPEERPEASSLKTELEKWTRQHLLLRNVTV